MTVSDLIKELSQYPTTDHVEIFIGDLENKRTSTLSSATTVMRCPDRFGAMRMLDAHKTVWITST